MLLVLFSNRKKWQLGSLYTSICNPFIKKSVSKVTKLKMYPYFDLAHAALCCLAVRDDLGAGQT